MKWRLWHLWKRGRKKFDKNGCNFVGLKALNIRIRYRLHPGMKIMTSILSSSLSCLATSFFVIIILLSNDVTLRNVIINIWFSGSVARRTKEGTNTSEASVGGWAAKRPGVKPPSIVLITWHVLNYELRMMFIQTWIHLNSRGWFKISRFSKCFASSAAKLVPFSLKIHQPKFSLNLTILRGFCRESDQARHRIPVKKSAVC